MMLSPHAVPPRTNGGTTSAEYQGKKRSPGFRAEVRAGLQRDFSRIFEVA